MASFNVCIFLCGMIGITKVTKFTVYNCTVCISLFLGIFGIKNNGHVWVFNNRDRERDITIQ